jgi:hypothetical protein
LVIVRMTVGDWVGVRVGVIVAVFVTVGVEVKVAVDVVVGQFATVVEAVMFVLFAGVGSEVVEPALTLLTIGLTQEFTVT